MNHISLGRILDYKFDDKFEIFFFSVYVAFAANQLLGYSPSSAIHTHADAIDNTVGIRKKRGLLKANPKLITGARFLWRVRQAKKVLLKDAVLVDTIFSTSEKMILAQMGKYINKGPVQRK